MKTKRLQQYRQKTQLFDLTNSNVDILGQNIVHAVTNEIDLVCYSQQDMIHPELSVTEIPGLTLLFLKAAFVFNKCRIIGIFRLER